MFCNKCGNQVPDGMSFCNRCGAPVNAAPSAPREPYTRGGNPVDNVMDKIYVKKPSFLDKGSSEMWKIVMFALAALTIVIMIFGGLTVSGGFMGFSFGVSLPYTSVGGSVSSSLPQGIDFGGLFFWCGAYRVILCLSIILFMAYVFFIYNKSSIGVIGGLAANAIVVIISIIMIIVSFAAGGNLQSFVNFIIMSQGGMSMPGMGNMNGMVNAGIHPTIWTWLTLVFGLANGAFLLFKGRDLIK